MGTCYSSKTPEGTDTYVSDMANNPQPHPASYRSGPYSRPSSFGFKKGGGPRFVKAPPNSNEQVAGPPDERAALLTIQTNGDSGTSTDSTRANNKNAGPSRFGFKPNQDNRVRKSDSNSNLTNGSTDSRSSTSQSKKNNVTSSNKKFSNYTASELVNGEPERSDVWPYIDDEKGSRSSVSSGKENDHTNDNETTAKSAMNGNHVEDESDTGLVNGTTSCTSSQNGQDYRKANVGNKIPGPGSKLPSRFGRPTATTTVEKKVKPESKAPVTVSNIGAGNAAKKANKGGTFSSRLGGLMPRKDRRGTPPRGVQFRNANEAKNSGAAHGEQNGESKRVVIEAPEVKNK